MFFKTTENIKEHLPVSIAFDFKDIKPDIRRAEQKFIKPILGADLYKLLDEGYKAASLNEKNKELLEVCLPAIANLAYWFYVPKGNVRVTASGIDVTVTENRRNAPEWAVRNLKNSFRDTGFEELENILEFLEENKEDYEDWTSSDAYVSAKKYFINSAKEFSRFISPPVSRLTFINILAEMERTEKRIRTITCKPLFDALKAEIQAGSISENNETILEMIQEGIANLTWASAMINLPVLVDDEGVHIFNSSFSGITEGKQAAEQQRLMAITEKHRTIGEAALKDLADHLQKNATSYPLFAGSECYVEDSSASPKNRKDSGLYHFL